MYVRTSGRGRSRAWCRNRPRGAPRGTQNRGTSAARVRDPRAFSVHLEFAGEQSNLRHGVVLPLLLARSRPAAHRILAIVSPEGSGAEIPVCSGPCLAASPRLHGEWRLVVSHTEPSEPPVPIDVSVQPTRLWAGVGPEEIAGMEPHAVTNWPAALGLCDHHIRLAAVHRATVRDHAEKEQRSPGHVVDLHVDVRSDEAHVVRPGLRRDG